MNQPLQKYTMAVTPELKTEGYSADIVRTYIPGDICMSAQHLPRETYILREMLCGHISPGIYVRTISFFGFQLGRIINSNDLFQGRIFLRTK